METIYIKPHRIDIMMKNLIDKMIGLIEDQSNINIIIIIIIKIIIYTSCHSIRVWCLK